MPAGVVATAEEEGAEVPAEVVVVVPAEAEAEAGAEEVVVVARSAAP